MQVTIGVQEDAFSVEQEHLRLKQAGLGIGAVVTFTGSVRDINEGDDVSRLHLEHYPGMTEKEIGRIIDEAAQRWSLIGVTVIHRVGDLAPGEDIVLVAVAGEHRGECFKACEFIMDYLKTRATFWKKEKSEAGDRWLSTRESDVEAAATWQSDN